MGVPYRAYHTLPVGLRMGQSRIPGAGLGIFAEEFLPANTWLGEYEGEIVTREEWLDNSDWMSWEYMWMVEKSVYDDEGDENDELLYAIDGSNPETSNWLRFVNSPRHFREENVEAHSCYGKIYYRTTRAVWPGQELLVYYGDQYAETLGIDVQAYSEAKFGKDELHRYTEKLQTRKENKYYCGDYYCYNIYDDPHGRYEHDNDYGYYEDDEFDDADEDDDDEEEAEEEEEDEEVEEEKSCNGYNEDGNGYGNKWGVDDAKDGNDASDIDFEENAQEKEDSNDTDELTVECDSNLEYDGGYLYLSHRILSWQISEWFA